MRAFFREDAVFSVQTPSRGRAWSAARSFPRNKAIREKTPGLADDCLVAVGSHEVTPTAPLLLRIRDGI